MGYKTRVKRRASHEPNSIQPMRLTWSSGFDPIKLDWFYLERLRRSSRLASREERLKTDFGSNADFHMSRTKRIINVNQSHVNVWICFKIYESASILIFSNMAAYRGGWWRFLYVVFGHDEISLPSFPGWKSGTFFAHCVPCSK